MAPARDLGSSRKPRPRKLQVGKALRSYLDERLTKFEASETLNLEDTSWIEKFAKTKITDDDEPIPPSERKTSEEPRGKTAGKRRRPRRRKNLQETIRRGRQVYIERSSRNRDRQPKAGRRRRFGTTIDYLTMGRVNSSVSEPDSQATLRRLNTDLDYLTRDGTQGSVSEPVSGVAPTPQTPQKPQPNMIVAKFIDETVGANNTTVWKISRPFPELLELLTRMSGQSKASYVPSSPIGFTVEDGPWWYHIISQPIEESENVDASLEWDLLGNHLDFKNLVYRVVNDVTAWSVAFKHVSYPLLSYLTYIPFFFGLDSMLLTGHFRYSMHRCIGMGSQRELRLLCARGPRRDRRRTSNPLR